MVVRSPYRLSELLKGPSTPGSLKKGGEEAELQGCKAERMSSPPGLLRFEVHNQAFGHGDIIRRYCVFRWKRSQIEPGLCSLDVGSYKHCGTVLLHSPHEVVLPSYPADEDDEWRFRLVIRADWMFVGTRIEGRDHERTGYSAHEGAPFAAFQSTGLFVGCFECGSPERINSLSPF
jgi:hypothetical protein